MQSNWVKQLFSSSKLSRLTAFFINTPIQKIKQPAALAGLITLIAVLAGLGLWHIQANRSAAKASATDDSSSVNQSTLSVSTSLIDGVSQDNPGSNAQSPAGLNVSANTNPPSVTVNGQTFVPPKSNSFNKTVKTDDGSVNVSIQANSASATSKSGHSYQNVSVHSNSDVNSNLQISQQTSGAGH